MARAASHPWKKTVLYHRDAASNVPSRERERERERSDETPTDCDCVTPRKIIKEHFAAATEDLVERSEWEERERENKLCRNFVSFDRRRHR